MFNSRSGLFIFESFKNMNIYCVIDALSPDSLCPELHQDVQLESAPLPIMSTPEPWPLGDLGFYPSIL